MNIRRPVIGKRPPVSSFGVQPVAVEFTAAEIEILRQTAEAAREIIKGVGGRFESYQEKRYEFAKEWAEGNHWNSKKSIAWAERIKREVKALMLLRNSAGNAAGTTSGSACGTDIS